MRRVILSIIAAIVLLAVSCKKGTDGGGDFPGLSIAFDIKISGVTASCAAVTVTATSGSDLFYFDVIESEALTAFDTPRELAEGWVGKIFELIDEYNEYDDADYTLMDFLSRGSDSYHYTCQLSPKTRYAVLAFEVDSEGRVGANMSIAEFDTTEVKESNNTFEITIDGTFARVNASIKSEYYLFDIYRSEELKDLSEQQIISRLIYDAIDYGIDDFVMGCGFDELDYGEYLINGLAYSAVCVGYDGGATTSLTRYDFVYKNASADDDVELDFTQGTSNLKTNVDFRGEWLKVVCYGDVYGTGTTVYKFSSATQSCDVGFSAEICVDADKESFVGTYHTIPEIGVPNSMVCGYQRGEQDIFGSWFLNSKISERSAALDGVTTILLNGDNITITAEWTDINSIKVKASYSGTYTYYDSPDVDVALAAATPSAAILFESIPQRKNRQMSAMHPAVNRNERIAKRTIKVSLVR